MQERRFLEPSSRCGVLLVGALSAVMITAPATAQTIAGTIRESGGGPPIAGGFVSLLDVSGAAVQADFTTADGAFSLTARGPGEYRVRVERIGYSNWITEVYRLAAGQRETLVIEVPLQPVLLTDLRVEVTRSCLNDPTQGAELATVWAEARKALETAVWAERRGEVTFTLTEYTRTLEPGSLATLEAESRTRRRVRLPPFESVPVSQLVDSGYAVVHEDSSIYYAPDATVLLSQEFQDTHCFGLRRARFGDQAMLGVTFRPRGARLVVDVEGTLWLDETNAELRRVQLLYRNVPLPRGADRRLVGADLVFDRLPDGPFYVSEWWIRFPILGQIRRLGTAATADRFAAVLVGYRQTGGSVTNAFVGADELGVGDGFVTGFVFDSVSGGPLAGAEVVLRDWDDAADFLPQPDPTEAPFSGVTDAEGAFVLPGMPDGTYAIRVDHPRLRAVGVRLNERRIRIEDRSSEPLELWTPSAETLYARLCSASALDKARGAIVGFARQEVTGIPRSGVDVEARWRVRRITVAAGGDPQLSELWDSAAAVTDERGRFSFCDVPLGVPVQLRANDGGDPVTFEQDARVLWRDVPVDPQGAGDPGGSIGR